MMWNLFSQLGYQISIKLIQYGGCLEMQYMVCERWLTNEATAYWLTLQGRAEMAFRSWVPVLGATEF